jgi:hypothetical protein
MTRSLIAVLLLALLFAAVVSAGHVCKNKDCSDVVGEALVKDNLGTSKHFTDRHHDDWKEEHRVKRIEMLRREKPSL